ncbi:TIGR02530 family flagellar biosynthesis protein [Acetobacterium sp.]|uniref:TIGR02530 family flagellar biosynthesis protein n=1 Tax=Acetobacterium sp. TaxID=1872094 RepID=UPI002F41EB6A
MANPIIGNHNSLINAISRQTKIITAMNQTQSAKELKKTNASFQELLSHEVRNTVTFSKHANIRKEQRNIEVSESDLEKLGNACDEAQKKGIDNALIIIEDSAFIVNAVNKRVITVVDKNEMKNKLFNDIDGAVFL